MKLRIPLVAMLLASLLIFAGINIVQAQWDAIGSGYAVTTNWHGIEVPIGQSVTATAGTTDGTIKKVEFRWHAPDGTVIWDVNVSIAGPIITPNVPPLPIPQEIIDWANQHDGTNPKYPKITYYYAQDTKIPSVLGDWGVQAIFHDTGRIMGKNSDIVRIRSTSFEVVPEVPFGTIVILLSWFGVLGVFALRRKHNLT